MILRTATFPGPCDHECCLVDAYDGVFTQGGFLKMLTSLSVMDRKLLGTSVSTTKLKIPQGKVPRDAN